MTAPRTWTIIECPDCGAIRPDAEPYHRSGCMMGGALMGRHGNWVEVVEVSAYRLVVEALGECREQRMMGEASEGLLRDQFAEVVAERDRLEQAMSTVLLQACNGHTAPDSVLRDMLANVARIARAALSVSTEEENDGRRATAEIEELESGA